MERRDRSSGERARELKRTSLKRDSRSIAACCSSSSVRHVASPAWREFRSLAIQINAFKETDILNGNRTNVAFCCAGRAVSNRAHHSPKINAIVGMRPRGNHGHKVA